MAAVTSKGRRSSRARVDRRMPGKPAMVELFVPALQRLVRVRRVSPQLSILCSVASSQWPRKLQPTRSSPHSPRSVLLARTGKLVLHLQPVKAPLTTLSLFSGHFHADEALAVSLLRSHPSYISAPLVRTRDPALLATCHTVVDVGGEYDPSRHRYDHHQRSFDHTFPRRATKLSSAGLVWLHFGRDIIAARTWFTAEDDAVRLLWEKLYLEFIEAIDAHDNGISVYDGARLEAAGVEKRFRDGGVSIGALVGDLNPSWNEPLPQEPEKEGPKLEDERFDQATKLIGGAFERRMDYYIKAWLPARSIVHKAYAERTKHDPRGRLLVFDHPVPWRDHLYDAEATTQAEEKVLYVLYPESPAEKSKWRIQAVPVSKDSFESRKPLPDAWRGLRDETLDEVTGVPGGVFVHASGFIGGNKTWEGVVSMAAKALDM